MFVFQDLYEFVVFYFIKSLFKIYKTGIDISVQASTSFEQARREKIPLW